MFNNKRSSHSNSNPNAAVKRISSYDSGKASIVVQTRVQTPLRTSSLYNSYSQEIFQVQQQIKNHKPIDEFEEVELVDGDTSSNSSASSSDEDELSLSAAEIAASVRSSRILTPSDPVPTLKKKDNNKKKQNRLSRMIFGWAHGSSKKASSMPVIVPSSYDDGREELLYRGIQVKELRTTLDAMILECPKPQPQALQRPEFARLSY